MFNASSPVAHLPSFELHTVWPGAHAVEPFASQARRLKEIHQVLQDWPIESIIGAWRAYSLTVHNDPWCLLDKSDPDPLFEAYLADVEKSKNKAWGLPGYEPFESYVEPLPYIDTIENSDWAKDFVNAVNNRTSGLWVLHTTQTVNLSPYLVNLAKFWGRSQTLPIYRVHNQNSPIALNKQDNDEDIGHTNEDHSPVRAPIQAHVALEKACGLQHTALIFDDWLNHPTYIRSILSCVANGSRVITRSCGPSLEACFDQLSHEASKLYPGMAQKIHNVYLMDYEEGNTINWP